MNEYSRALNLNLIENIILCILMIISAFEIVKGKFGSKTLKILDDKSNKIVMVIRWSLAIICIAISISVSYDSLVDYIKRDFITDQGEITEIHFRAKDLLYINVTINNEEFFFRKDMWSPNLLVKDKTYKITYTKREKLILEIEKIE